MLKKKHTSELESKKEQHAGERGDAEEDRRHREERRKKHNREDKQKWTYSHI